MTVITYLEQQITHFDIGAMALSKLAACLLNVSEAENRHIVEKIAKAGIVKSFTKDEQERYITSYNDDKSLLMGDSHKDLKHVTHDNSSSNIRDELFGANYRFQSTILNIFSDQIYNRSVITIAGTLPGVEKGVISACNEAFRSLKGNISKFDSFKRPFVSPRFANVWKFVITYENEYFQESMNIKVAIPGRALLILFQFIRLAKPQI